PWTWGRSVGGDLWRTTGDIRDSWTSMLSILDRQVGLEKYSGPNAWNEPDMLEVGNGRMTNAEYMAHFSLWSLLNAPLIAGNDLRSMTDSTKDILTNREVIAVDQDWGGMQGHKIRDDAGARTRRREARGARSVGACRSLGRRGAQRAARAEFGGDVHRQEVARVERDRSQSNDDARYVRVYDVRDGDGQAGAGRASQPLSLNGVTTRLVETGEILTVDGVITRLLETGLPGGGWLEFEMDSGGERSQWSRMASGS